MDHKIVVCASRMIPNKLKWLKCLFQVDHLVISTSTTKETPKSTSDSDSKVSTSKVLTETSSTILSAVTATAPSKTVTGVNNTVYVDIVSEVKDAQRTQTEEKVVNEQPQQEQKGVVKTETVNFTTKVPQATKEVKKANELPQMS